jgi:ribokinase
MPSVEVLVVGDANPDLVLAGDTVPRFGQAEQLLDRADLVLGGSAALVACGLALLEVRVGLVAVVGADAFGGLICGWLDERGVDPAALTVDPEMPTGLSVILLTQDDRTILTLPGTVPRLTADAVLAEVGAARPLHVHVASYFLQPGLAAELPELLDRLGRLGISTSLDTNWDPAGRWSGLANVLARVDVFLPNRSEAVAVAGALGADAGDDALAAARALATYGCRVVVKSGTDGAMSVAPNGVVTKVSAFPVEVVDTTGAGDSFDAGYLGALVGGVADEAERLRWGVVAGALSTRGVGGTATQATRAEVVAAIAR